MAIHLTTAHLDTDAAMPVSKAAAEALSSATSFTYSALSALKTAGTLVAGKFYRITDFQTIHIIPNTSALNVQGTVYENKATWTQSNSEGNEPLIVLAVSTNAFAVQAYSATNKQDIIYYDFENNLCEDGTTPRKGFITYRKNVKYNLETYYDWRVHRFRRWKINPTTWTAGTYALNAVVLYNDKMYYSKVASNTATPGSSLDNWVPFWSLASNSLYYLYGAPDWWIAHKSTGFTIALKTVSVDATNFVDYYTFSRFNGTGELPTTNFTFDIEEGRFTNISIPKDTGSPSNYNNILFLLRNMRSPTSFNNYTFGRNCRNMTIGWGGSNVAIADDSRENIFKLDITNSKFLGAMNDNVHNWAVNEVTSLGLWAYNISLESCFIQFCAFGMRYTLNNLFAATFQFSSTQGRMEACEFRGTVDYLHSNMLSGVRCLGTLNQVSVTCGLSSRTITQNLNNVGISVANTSGSLWSVGVEEATGRLVTTQIT